MPVSMIVLETAALCLSVLGAGLFLRMERRSVLISVCVAGLAGGASFSLLPEAIGVAAGPYAGLPLAAFSMALLSRRPAMDGLLVFLTGACYWRTWTVFHTWVVEVCESTVALWFFSGFFLLHLPAVLVTFPEFSLPCGWQSQLRGKTGGLRPRHIVELGAALLVLLELAAMALPAEGVHAAVKALLITALFWAALSLLPMLTAYGRKRAQSEAETVYRQDMTTFMNVVRSQRHDYNLHVQTVASLIAQEKWEDCRSYVHALTQDTAEINTVLPISDPAVAALIGNFKTLAAQRGIRLVTDIRDDLSKVVTGAYETNKILGNLLQNALDET